MITHLFLDIGGVLMTNGWDHTMREKAAHAFDLDLVDFEKRHRLFYDPYEQGKETLDHYLQQTIFYIDRGFSIEKFKEFIFLQSKAHQRVIQFFSKIKKEYALHIATVSNEGRELAEYRIKKAHLRSFVDDFFISGFLGYQKPDSHIYKIALDVTQAKLDQIIYVDDRPELIEAAAKLGIKGILHHSLQETEKFLMNALKTHGTR